MKRILIFIFVIAIVYIAFNQYLTYRRYNPASAYIYEANPEIDVNYHNQKIVEEYYDLAFKIGSYARQIWYNDGIDVLYPSDYSEQGINAANYYNQMLARAKYLEQKLITSANLKNLKFDNEQIKFIEEKGISEEHYELYKVLEKKNAVKDDVSQLVWSVQERLIKKGYDIPLDGKFIDITENAVKDFQKKNNLYPSGVVDETTLRLLLK